MFKPYDDQKPTDFYYLAVSNEVNKSIAGNNQLQMYLDTEVKQTIAQIQQD